MNGGTFARAAEARARAARGGSPGRPCLGALTVVFGVGLMATAGYLISRAAERPAILSLMVTIVAVQFFGIGRPVLRYLERLASHDIDAARARPAARALLRADRAARPGGARGLPQGRPAVADGRGRRRAPEPVPARTRAAARRAPRRRRLGRCRGRLPARCRASCSPAACSWPALAVPALAGFLGARAGRRQAAARGELSAELVELLRGAPELVAFGAEGPAVERDPRRRPDAGQARPPRRARRRRRRRPRARGHRRDRRRRARRRGRPRPHNGAFEPRADRDAGAARARRRSRPSRRSAARRPRAVGDARRRPAGPRAHRSQPGRSRSVGPGPAPALAVRGGARGRPGPVPAASSAPRSTASVSGSSPASGSRCSARAAPARRRSRTCCSASSIPSGGA